MSFELGQTSEGYQFVDVLNTSGLGVAYKVWNLSCERFECLSTLPDDFGGNHYGEDRFQREIRIHRQLTHPNIASFYRSFKIGHRFVITTELPEGISLEKRFQEGYLSIQEGVDYVCQALEGIGYAHSKGVVHRCLAPSNLIITPDDRIKVIGFGFAKTPSDPRLTLQGFVIGVAEYIAPEQVNNTSRLDGRADLYSLGAILYEAISGRKVFESKNYFELMSAHKNLRPRPPGLFRPDLPTELEEFMLQALQKDPSQRFQTADAFRAALLAVTAIGVA